MPARARVRAARDACQGAGARARAHACQGAGARARARCLPGRWCARARALPAHALARALAARALARARALAAHALARARALAAHALARARALPAHALARARALPAHALARAACQGAVVCKGFYPPLDGNCASRRLTGLIRPARVANGTCLWGAEAPYCLVGKRTTGAHVASSPDSDLEAFSHNPTHGSFAPLAFQPSAMTNCANQRFLSY
ncbi:hypothetical protein VNO78_36606 [Psophocarpus tetragonolobus]|uniref:Uncharacterized protein n=1 Tax=Psophocarpus tetragonolobus TaxID=3891 RepID=A0AAN9NKL2_PSOTE